MNDKTEEDDLVGSLGKGFKLFEPEHNKELYDKMVRRQEKPMQDQANVVEYMSRTFMVPGSDYHFLIEKELSMSNVKRSDVAVIEKNSDVINNAIYLGRKGVVTADLALIDSAEEVRFLNILRSIGMEHERLMATNTLKVTKEEITRNRSWFERSQKTP